MEALVIRPTYAAAFRAALCNCSRYPKALALNPPSPETKTRGSGSRDDVSKSRSSPASCSSGRRRYDTKISKVFAASGAGAPSATAATGIRTSGSATDIQTWSSAGRDPVKWRPRPIGYVPPTCKGRRSRFRSRIVACPARFGASETCCLSQTSRSLLIPRRSRANLVDSDRADCGNRVWSACCGNDAPYDPTCGHLVPPCLRGQTDRRSFGAPGDDRTAPNSVGARGFEPPTSCSQSRRATRLRHAPSGVNIHDPRPRYCPR